MLLKRSKAALALGVILGGASLFGGEAKAVNVTTLQCNFNGGTGATPPPSSNCDPLNPFKLGDKKFTFGKVTSTLGPNLPKGHIEFTWIDPTGDLTGYGDDSWSITTIFDDPLVGISSGSIDYTLAVTDHGWYFHGAKLDSEVLSPGGVTVEKWITEYSTTTPFLTSVNGTPAPLPPAMKPLGGTFITVSDKWDVKPDGALTSIVNTYHQVPAPLPLLGVGAVFGSIRKLRKFSSQLKTFSMG